MYKKLFGIMVLFLATGSASASNYRFQIDISNPGAPIVSFQCSGNEAGCKDPFSPPNNPPDYQTAAFGNGSIQGDYHVNPMVNLPNGDPRLNPLFTINERANGELLNLTTNLFYFSTPAEYYFGSIQNAYLLDITSSTDTGSTFILKTGAPGSTANQKSYGDEIDLLGNFRPSSAAVEGWGNITGVPGESVGGVYLQVIPEPEILLLLIVGSFSLLAFSGKKVHLFKSQCANMA
ncbi:hypothetical protein [Methylomonas methanica]|uniref:PEP-CTERM protein-sorting domain-containing protein n=1 Tax=Methylomonas methanica TaxID=421 RepID=A0A177MLJ4_METMH|nr:hypothetical protein [Methylomonas methanica]OAI05739.1 hypothetical protein A1332_12405 [Methylomonas methanica]